MRTGYLGLGNIIHPLHTVSSDAADVIKTFAAQNEDTLKGGRKVVFDDIIKNQLKVMHQVATKPEATYDDLIQCIVSTQEEFKAHIQSERNQAGKQELRRMADNTITLLKKALIIAAKKDGLHEMVQASLEYNGLQKSR